MIKIRNGCFETNSSSSHAMIVMKDDRPLPQMFEPKQWYWDNRITIWEDNVEFGRTPFEVLTDWYGRMCYAIASYGKEHYPEIEAIIYKRIAGLKEIVFHGNRNEYDKYGYVDHQSNGLLQDFINSRGITIEDFIFNDRYVVVIDGDEYNVFDTMVEAGLINESQIVDRLYAFGD